MGAPHIYDISRLRVNITYEEQELNTCNFTSLQMCGSWRWPQLHIWPKRVIICGRY